MESHPPVNFQNWTTCPFQLRNQSESQHVKSKLKEQKHQRLHIKKKKKQGVAKSLFLSWEHDFAQSADVPRAVWLSDLQLGERWHGTAGEVSECRAGWLDGIQKYLGDKKQTHPVVRCSYIDTLTSICCPQCPVLNSTYITILMKLCKTHNYK